MRLWKQMRALGKAQNLPSQNFPKSSTIIPKYVKLKSTLKTRTGEMPYLCGSIQPLQFYEDYHSHPSLRVCVHPYRPISLCRIMASSCMDTSTGLLLQGPFQRCPSLKQRSLVKFPSFTHSQYIPSLVQRGPSMASSSKVSSNLLAGIVIFFSSCLG